MFGEYMSRHPRGKRGEKNKRGMEDVSLVRCLDSWRAVATASVLRGKDINR